MKRLSLQWRIMLMTALLISGTCVTMQLLLGSSGIHYMDSIGKSLQGYTIDGEPAFFDPEPGQNLTIVINGAQKGFRVTN